MRERGDARNNSREEAASDPLAAGHSREGEYQIERQPSGSECGVRTICSPSAKCMCGGVRKEERGAAQGGERRGLRTNDREGGSD